VGFYLTNKHSLFIGLWLFILYAASTTLPKTSSNPTEMQKYPTGNLSANTEILPCVTKIYSCHRFALSPPTETIRLTLHIKKANSIAKIGFAVLLFHY
jgi:hypothetical protein